MVDFRWIHDLLPYYVGRQTDGKRSETECPSPATISWTPMLARRWTALRWRQLPRLMYPIQQKITHITICSSVRLVSAANLILHTKWIAWHLVLERHRCHACFLLKERVFLQTAAIFPWWCPPFPWECCLDLLRLKLWARRFRTGFSVRWSIAAHRIPPCARKKNLLQTADERSSAIRLDMQIRNKDEDPLGATDIASRGSVIVRVNSSVLWLRSVKDRLLWSYQDQPPWPADLLWQSFLLQPEDWGRRRSS